MLHNRCSGVCMLKMCSVSADSVDRRYAERNTVGYKANKQAVMCSAWVTGDTTEATWRTRSQYLNALNPFTS